jgi:hypothetical protein
MEQRVLIQLATGTTFYLVTSDGQIFILYLRGIPILFITYN